MNLHLYGSRKPLYCSFCVCGTGARTCRGRRRWDGLAPRLRYRHVRSLMTDVANESTVIIYIMYARLAESLLPTFAYGVFTQKLSSFRNERKPFPFYCL